MLASLIVIAAIASHVYIATVVATMYNCMERASIERQHAIATNITLKG